MAKYRVIRKISYTESFECEANSEDEAYDKSQNATEDDWEHNGDDHILSDDRIKLIKE